MICPVCEGNGCDECEDGRVKITECPLVLVPENIWEVIKFAELYEKGLPPIAGGALDQAKSFIDAALFIMREKSYWKNKLGALD